MKTNNDEKKFLRVLHGLETNPCVQELKKYRQHRGNTTFSHCHNVAMSSFRMAQKLGLRVDEPTLARGAMLHDFHLYTRENRPLKSIHHLFAHPKTALRNAEKSFDLNKKERNIIRSHMWPLTLFSPPRSKEALLVTLADKYCALREMLKR